MTKQVSHCYRHAQRPALSRSHRWSIRLLTAGGLGLATILTLTPAPAAAGEPPLAVLTTDPPNDPVGMVASALTECSNRLNRQQRWSIARMIHDESTEQGYDPLFITALVQVESGCSPTARGGGAIGLTQLLPSTARGVASRAGVTWRGPQTLNDPEANLQIGIQYLRELEELLDDPYKAVAAYNMGPAPVLRMSSKRAQGVRYVRKVMARYEALRELYA